MRSTCSIIVPSVLVALSRLISATSMLNGLMWTVYGLATGDVYVWAPNAFGAVVSAFQLFLCAIFPA